MGFRRRIAGRACLILLAIWALAMILPSLYRLAAPLGSFGLSANNDGVIIDLTVPFDSEDESPAARAGLRVGEQLDLQAMHCLPPTTAECGGAISVTGGRSWMEYALPGSTITLRVREAAGRVVRRVLVHAAPVRDGWPELLVLVLDTTGGVFFLAVSFALVWRRPSRMTWGFFLYALWFNPGQNSAFYAFLQPWPVALLVQEAAEALAKGAGLAGLFTLALRFPGNRLEQRWRRLDSLLPALGALFALLAIATRASDFGFATASLTQASLLLGLCINLAILAVLVIRRRSLAPLDEQRMRWVIAGAALGLPAFILARIAQSSGILVALGGGSVAEVVVGLLTLVNGVLAYFVAEAIRRRRVVTLAIPLHRGMVATLAALVLGIPVVYAHERLAAYHEGFHLPEWTWLFVVAPIVLIILHRAQEKLVVLTEHIFVHAYYRTKQRLEMVTEALQQAESPGDIDRVLVQGCVEALGVASGALFRADGDNVRLGPCAPGWARVSPERWATDPDGPVRRGLASGRPISLPRSRREDPDLPVGVAAPCLAVPLAARAGEADAVLVLGAHADGTDISGDESELLHGLAIRAAELRQRSEIRALRRELHGLRAELSRRGEPAAPASGEAEG